MDVPDLWITDITNTFTKRHGGVLNVTKPKYSHMEMTYARKHNMT